MKTSLDFITLFLLVILKGGTWEDLATMLWPRPPFAIGCGR